MKGTDCLEFWNEIMWFPSKVYEYYECICNDRYCSAGVLDPAKHDDTTLVDVTLQKI